MDPTAEQSGVLTVDGLQFRDLDHDGVLAPYEDWRRPIADRVEDLVARMTLAEKVATMMHGTAPAGGPMGMIGMGSAYDLEALDQLVVKAGVTSMITRLSQPPQILAEQNNAIQAIAARGRLGIPATISTDPRNHLGAVFGAGVEANGFSQWPGFLGLGAIDDVDVARQYGDIVRQECRAVGITMALAPQADLATEPRWPRSDGTFGSDPARVGPIAAAVVEGFQGSPTGPTATGLASVLKHWVGYGAARDGFDGHNYYGRFSAFPTGRFQDHVDAFVPSFGVGVAGVMPTYNILEGVTINGEPVEQVGAGFSRQLLDLLRDTYGYQGVIVSDWSITKDSSPACETGEPAQTPNFIAMPWGVEHLSRVERFAKGVHAGIDQFGGDNDPSFLMEALATGLVSEERVDASVRRIMALKFQLGLFDNPFVDPVAAGRVVGSPEFAAAAAVAQARSVTVLESPVRELVGHIPVQRDEDGHDASTSTNPADAVSVGPRISASDSVYVYGMAPDALVAAGLTVTTDRSSATVAVVRLKTPHQMLHPNHFFGSRQHEGDLDFKPDHPDLVALTQIAADVPAIVVVNLDRAAILANIKPLASVLLAEYGISDEALVAALTGNTNPAGRLPIPLPADMASVNRADGSFDILFPEGKGL